MFTSNRWILRYAATIEPSSAMSAEVFAVRRGSSTFSEIEPATMKMPRRLASSRRAPSVGPRASPAPAIRPSSGPMYAKFSGRPTSFAPRSAASFDEPDRDLEIPRPIRGRRHLDRAHEVSGRRHSDLLTMSARVRRDAELLHDVRGRPLLGVSLPTVVNWIKGRRLKAHRTPGGHRRIAHEDLAAFMLRHGIPLPAELSGAARPARKALVIADAGPAREGRAPARRRRLRGGAGVARVRRRRGGGAVRARRSS